MPSTTPKITGRTRILAILADPVHHVKTPQRINELLRARGIDAVMVPLHVNEGELPVVLNALRGMLNFDGCVVTVPHKTKALALCDELSDEARQIGAVNVLRRMADGRLRGGMLDGVGFVAGLRSANIDPTGMTVYLAGAGGAASAIAFSLAKAGARHLTVANRSTPKAANLVERLRREYPLMGASVGNSDPSDHDIIVNATSLGMRMDDPLPLNVSKLRAAQIVAEIIMDPVETQLLKAARECGCRVHEGAPMLVSQVLHMAAFMLDQPLAHVQSATP